ncbi:unnamed protein product [Prorocentrum cordatum]|uniref:Uncharacterized protein n=1 Tax=Prorocentrum cordatum TaxID=2364126 RepID=A0ABN9VCH0_9DINO|nr:unnamed protein product [Polarella glacialis]
MGVGPEDDVQMILDEVGFEDKEPSSKKARQKGRPRPRRPRGGEGGEMSRFTVEQLQEALFALGSGPSPTEYLPVVEEQAHRDADHAPGGRARRLGDPRGREARRWAEAKERPPIR